MTRLRSEAVLGRLRGRLPSWSWVKLIWSVLRAGAPIWPQIERAGLWPYIAGALLLSMCTRAVARKDVESGG